MNFEGVDLSVYEGQVVPIELRHVINNKQYGRFDLDNKSFSGWLDKVYGEEGSTVEKTIEEMFFVQHNNGGRRYSWRAKTYDDYFNDEVKQQVIAKRASGIFGALSMGDVESADIIVHFTDGTSLDTMQFIRCPEEWYTDQYKEKGEEMLERGFHETPEEALLALRSSDDIFGERYFPVVAFSLSISDSAIDEVVWIPKAASQPIKTDSHIVYGSRCKPHEVTDFVHSTYDIGGKVVKGSSWDWEG